MPGPPRWSRNWARSFACWPVSRMAGPRCGSRYRAILKSAGSDIHALAERIEKPNGNSLTEAEMKKLYDAGYAAGVQAAENRHQGIDDFSNTDGKPNWDAVALFLQRNKTD